VRVKKEPEDLTGQLKWPDLIRGSLTGRYQRFKADVRLVNILLERGEKKCFVEVKNCTLATDGIAYFRDATTARGLKHLRELQKEVSKGNRAVMFYLIQRMDARGFRPASSIDPAYGLELEKAVDSGVEVLAYDAIIDLKGISINKKLPFRL